MPHRHYLRDTLREQEDDAAQRRVAVSLTLADIAAPARDLDPDDLLPIREIVAALLGLDPRKPQTRHAWADQYAQHISDDDARERLQKLVQRSTLLADELKNGPAPPPVTALARVDKALKIADQRGWRAASASSTPKPVQRRTAQELAILAKLRELGIDPLAIPYRSGEKEPVKSTIRKALGYTIDVMKKAWLRLKADKEIVVITIKKT